MEPTIIAVVGSKESGKTTTIEALIRELTNRGYKVAAVKHIPEKDFTIDTKNKDTWRFAASGAKKVVSVSPKEIAIIEKGDSDDLSIKDILEKCCDCDIIIIEGFRRLLGENADVPKIMAVKSLDEAHDGLKSFKPIIAFTGLHAVMGEKLLVPFFNVLREQTELAEFVERIIRKKRGFWNSS